MIKAILLCLFPLCLTAQFTADEVKLIDRQLKRMVNLHGQVDSARVLVAALKAEIEIKDRDNERLYELTGRQSKMLSQQIDTIEKYRTSSLRYELQLDYCSDRMDPFNKENLSKDGLVFLLGFITRWLI